MADNNNQETNFIKDERKAEQTPVGRLAASFDKKDGTKISGQTEAFIKANNYSAAFPDDQAGSKLSKVFETVSQVGKDNFSEPDLIQQLENALGMPVSSYINDAATKKLTADLWDRYYAFYILSRSAPVNLDILTRNLRAIHVLKFAAAASIKNYDTLRKLASAQPLVSELFTNIPKPAIKIEKPAESKTDPEKIKEYKNLWNEFISTNRALEDVKKIKFETKTVSETKSITVPNKETGFEANRKLTLVRTQVGLDKRSFEGLHASTKAILNQYDPGSANFHVAEPALHLQAKLDGLYQQITAIKDPEFIRLIPAEAKGIQGLIDVRTKYEDNFNLPLPPPVPNTNVRAAIKPLGIGDLKVVKQKLKKYTAGEIAHIENVLRGEYKDRKHRVLDRTEEIFTIATEENEETTKDTQTTERFELKKESERTIQEEMNVSAGVTVSGSYGMVTFGAHGEFAYSTSSQESNKNASNFAREVVDRSVTKIQKKTRQERTTKKLHEVEEINTHGIDNKDKPDHAIGIYRWVDKFYEAQIFNYGKRLMFEFIIPEPAAFYEFAQVNKPKKDIIPPKKLNPLLTHKSITEYNFQEYIRDYNISGATLPPPLFKTISIIISTDANVQNGTALSKTSKELIVPEGYTLASSGFSLSTIYENNPQLKLSVGANDLLWATITDNDARKRMDIQVGEATYYEGIIPVSINCYDINSFFVNVTAVCRRSDFKYEQWQIQTFEKIKDAYRAMQMDYEDKLAAQQAQVGIAITGQNPRINREIEKTELKKQSIKLLMDTYLFGSFDAMKNMGTNPPDFDILDAMDEGKTIQFFEQAFEWENIVYLFYPYFWARKNQWMHKSVIYDNDPLFTKFLQAGSSRVVVPVHPAYNDAVMYFLENNGAIWNGGEPPRLNDPLYISLADELKAQTDDLANAIAEGESWEVILPTTLVYLQQSADLPTF